MSKHRELPPVINCPVHGDDIKPCIVMTSCAIHTIELPEGNFAALIIDCPDRKFGAVAILDREEVEAHILFLRNAIDDAERLDAGLAPLHSSPSLRRQ